MLSSAVVAALAESRAILVDATVGDGGHARALLTASGATARLLGIDLDPDALASARETLASFGGRVRLIRDTFASLTSLAKAQGFAPATGVLFDLGLRAGQLDASRGFSFRINAPLDMRFGPDGTVELPLPDHEALRALARAEPAYTAAQVVRRLREDELADLFWRYADERHARRIARAIVTTRTRAPIRTTGDLVRVIVRSLPPAARHGRTHAATRAFQALRIAVNREFESLRLGLQGATDILAPVGRLAVITYHSGEDRIVKQFFRAQVAHGFRLVERRPLVPSAAERAANPRSRSAKLRILRRTP